MDKGMEKGGLCKCPHHRMVPILVTVLGLVFLLGNLNVLTDSFVGIVWPLLVMGAGLTKLNEDRCKCC